MAITTTMVNNQQRRFASALPTFRIALSVVAAVVAVVVILLKR